MPRPQHDLHAYSQVVLFNHVSWVDGLVMMRMFAPSGVVTARFPSHAVQGVAESCSFLHMQCRQCGGHAISAATVPA